MKIKNVIFTAGLLDGDDYLMENVKGWRGDILVEDSNSNFFELTFIDTERLIIELEEKDYAYEEWGWIVVKKLNTSLILETIISLSNKGYFNTQKSKNNIKKTNSWTTIEIS